VESTIKNSSKETNKEMQARNLGRWTVAVLVFDEFEKFLGEGGIEKELSQRCLKGVQIVLGSRLRTTDHKGKDEPEWQNKD